MKSIGYMGSKEKLLTFIEAANDEPIQLFNEDALKHMSKMADESVDLVVTDPPYKVTDHSRAYLT